LNYSSWLTRLDSDTSDLKMHLIKILFVSLRSDKSFQMFLRPPPDDLNDLELRSDNTVKFSDFLIYLIYQFNGRSVHIDGYG